MALNKKYTFKIKVEAGGVLTYYHVVDKGKIIATFIAGVFVTDDETLAKRLIEMGYSDKEVTDTKKFDVAAPQAKIRIKSQAEVDRINAGIAAKNTDGEIISDNDLENLDLDIDLSKVKL